MTTNQRGQRTWKEDEEAALAASWLAISQDAVTGTNQTGETLWNRILVQFHERMGRGAYRNTDALSSKWRDLRASCTSFNGIYNNLSKMHKSGRSEFDVFNTALQQYRVQHGNRAFTHMKAWDVLKMGPKWALKPDVLTQSSGSNKRSRTSKSTEQTQHSDGRTEFNLNDEFEENEAEAEETPERTPRRPQGRDKGKRAASSSGKNAPDMDEFLYFKSTLDEHLEVQKAKLRIKEEVKRQNELVADMNILRMPAHDVEPEDLEMIRQIKREIREKYQRNQNNPRNDP